MNISFDSFDDGLAEGLAADKGLAVAEGGSTAVEGGSTAVAEGGLATGEEEELAVDDDLFELAEAPVENVAESACAAG